MIDGIDMLDTADTVTVVALFVIFSLWLSIEAMKMIRKKYKELDKQPASNFEILQDWLRVDLELALKVYTKYSKTRKHCIATYLTEQETLDDIEFITNIQGAKYVASSRSLIKSDIKKENDLVKSLLYLIDNSGVSYIIVTDSDVNYISEEQGVEQYKIFYLVENIFVVEKNRLSRISKSNTENILFINKDINNVNYHSYKDVIISNLTISGKEGYFTITDMDKPSDFITHKFKIELKDIYSI